MAGIWRKALPEALLWNVRGTPSERATPYIAPTWSWASLRRQTGYSTTCIAYPVELEIPWTNFGDNQLSHAEVRETHIDPLGIDHTGAARNGYLVLEAPLITFSSDWENPIPDAVQAAPH